MGESEPIGATRWHRAQTAGPPALWAPKFPLDLLPADMV